MKRFHIEYFDPGLIVLPFIENTSCVSLEKMMEVSVEGSMGDRYDVLIREPETLQVLALREKGKGWLKGDEAANKWADRVRSKGLEI